MKKSISKKYIAAFLCALALLLCSCSGANKFEMKDGSYVDKTSGISYIDALACYEPIKIGDTLYGRLGDVELYEIEGAEPKSWLCEKTGTVFYAEGVKLPTLDEMNISYAELYTDAESVERITDSTLISALVAIYTEGESVERPIAASASDYEINWSLKLADEELGLYYAVSYWRIDGQTYIFNRFENKCVLAENVLEVYEARYASEQN